ncbi:stalk domain-containing protein [Brevibacillus daliensis]|uniref:stalk domain-containing protein n=1 Tax=Brevibacillus daliensis TaxID=2892995 RepID=UPI001E55B274|nr:stalk domain-containing protein [Brevibacillus daliensis]
MNKSMKILSTAMLTAVVATGSLTAYAAPAAVTPISAQVTIKEGANKDFSIVINGEKVTGEVFGDKGVIMVPLRTITEKLGYEVTWNQKTKTTEMTKGAQWTTVTVGQDNYNFAKMSIKLGKAPAMKAGTTYVPLDFFEKVLQKQVVVGEDGTIQINDEMQQVAKKGSITNINLENKDGKLQGEILMNGNSNGIRLNITDETVIVNQKNEALKVEDLKLGQSIETVTSNFMTMSLPPMTNAEKIVVMDEEIAPVVLGTFGEVVDFDLKKLADGTQRLVIKGEKLNDQSYDTIALTITEDTQIIDAKNNAPLNLEALRNGSKVYGFYGPVVTKSNPAIGQAMKIVVEVKPEIEPMPAL